MKEIQKMIINELIHADRNISSQELATKINVSKRTIKGNVGALNAIYENLISSSVKGYCIEKGQAKKIMVENNKKPLPQTPNERVTYIVKKLLLIKTDDKESKLDIFDISEELIVSDATVNKDLIKVRTYLKKYHLDMASSKGKIQLIGKESDRRKALNDLYFTEIQKSEITIQSIQNTFPEYDIKKISDIILNACKKHHYFINQFSLLNIVMYIIVGIDRIKNNFSYSMNEERLPHTDINTTKEKALTKEISNALEQLYHFTYNVIEWRELNLLIVGNLLSSDYKKIEKENIEKIVGKDCIELVKAILEDVKEYYFLNDLDTDFFRKFSLHINNLLIRLRANYINKNPLTDSIKYSCPLLFDCVVKMSHTILHKTGYQISDDEIAYIVLHIGSIIDTREKNKNKINAVIIFPEYYDFASMLLEKIEKHFQDVTVQTIYTNITDFENRDNKEIDLIISTIPRHNFSKKIININPFLTKADIEKIQKEVTSLNHEKEINRLKKQLLQITKPNLFMINPPLKTQHEVIHYMSQQFVQEKIVSANFEKEVKNRELLSSTAFRNLAVPHSIHMDASKTMLSIAIFDKPVIWEDKHVNLVMLFAINEKDKSIFRNVFDKLIVLLTEQENILKVIKSKNYDEFIFNLLSLC